MLEIYSSLSKIMNKTIPQYRYFLFSGKVFLEVKGELFSCIVYTVE